MLRLAARPLLDEERKAFEPYFLGSLLDHLRVVQVEGFDIPKDLSWVLPDPDDIGAFTFDDTIASRVKLLPDRLFHEVVHVTQFNVVGPVRLVEAFLEAGSLFGSKVSCKREIRR